MVMRSCENYLVPLIPICLSLNSVAELIVRRIHKKKTGVRIPEVSESEMLSEHSDGEKGWRKEKRRVSPGGKKNLT